MLRIEVYYSEKRPAELPYSMREVGLGLVTEIPEDANKDQIYSDCLQNLKRLVKAEIYPEKK